MTDLSSQPEPTTVPPLEGPPHPGFTPHPGYAPQPQYVAVPPTGRKSWALGFLAYVPVPFASIVIAAIMMIAVYPSTKRKQVPVATENARIAANWGLTVLTVIVLLAVYTLTLALAFPETKSAGFFPIGFAVVGYLLLAITHAVVTIAGTVVSGTRVFRNRLSIPYLRPAS